MIRNQFKEVYDEFLDKLDLDPDRDYDTCLLVHRLAVLHIRLKRIEEFILMELDSCDEDGKQVICTPYDLEQKNMEKRFMEIMKEVRKYVRKGNRIDDHGKKPITEQSFDQAVEQAVRSNKVRKNHREGKADTGNTV